MLLSVGLLGLSSAGLLEWRKSRTLLLIAGPLFGIAALSALLGPHPMHGRIALWNFGAALIVMLAWGTRSLKVERVLGWTLLPGVVTAVLVLLQRFDLWRPFDLSVSLERIQMTGLIGNVGEAAMFMSLPVSVCIHRSLRRVATGGSRRALGFWVVTGLLLIAGILATETATAIGAVVLCAMVQCLSAPISRKVRVGLVVAAVVLLVGVLLSPLGGRVKEKGGFLVQGQIDELTTGRTDGWKAAAYMLQERPVLGIGFGGFIAEFTPAKEALVEAGGSFFQRHVGKSTFSNAHNEFLEWSAETGWLGMLVLLACLFVAAKTIRSHYFESPATSVDERESDFEVRLERSLVIALLLALVTACATYFPFRTALLAYPWVLLIAAMLGGQKAEIAEAPNAEKVAGPGSWSGPRWAGVAVALMLLMWSMAVSQRRLRASSMLLLAESTATSMAQQGRVYPTVLKSLLAPLERAGESTPWDERIPLAIAGYHLLLREPELAEPWYQKSLDIAPRPETIFNMGRALLQLGRRDEAVAMLVRGVRLDRLRRRVLDRGEFDSVRDEVMGHFPAARSRRGRPRANQ